MDIVVSALCAALVAAFCELVKLICRRKLHKMAADAPQKQAGGKKR